MGFKPVIDTNFRRLSARGRRWKNAYDADYIPSFNVREDGQARFLMRTERSAIDLLTL